MSFTSNHFNFNYLNNRCIIAVQAHVFYKELINEVINKTNNIPLKFDLYISSLPDGNKALFERYIKYYSKSNYYEILYTENKGRDILPFIQQMKNKFKKYKYICHIHTKKANHISTTGDKWRNYLYENLLGNSDKISQIIFDFEKIKELGLIFPEPYYDIIKLIKFRKSNSFKSFNNFETINFIFHKPNIKYMNFVLNKIFRKIKVGKKLIFPVGDMFWAKMKSIHQIFTIKFQKIFPSESGQINETIMHAIERIWLHLAKKNGYYYKLIFNHY